MFGVGDEVICIDSAIKPEMLMAVVNMYPNWVKKGRKYVIREISDNDGIVPGILLEELSNPKVYIKLIDRVQEPMFSFHRFTKAEPDASASMYYTEKIDNSIYAKV